MKAWFWSVGLVLFSPFFLWSALPETRIQDTDAVLSLPARMLLEDHLESMAKKQEVNVYVVILKSGSIEEASKLCDQWQAEWVPQGLGGVFVYLADEKKYFFSGTPETMERIDELELRKLLKEPIKNPLLGSSLDVEISAPVYRILTSLGQERLKYRMGAIEEAEKQSLRWKILTGIVAAFALLGWTLYSFKLIQGLSRGFPKGNIPPPGMAYGNPRERSRRRRRNKKGEDQVGDRY